jgi:WXG100 family type VII secretion target
MIELQGVSAKGSDMSDELRVDGSRIDLLVVEMERARAEIRRVLDDLEAQLDRLSNEWSGEAQQAYALAQGRWNASMGEIHDELERLRRRTEESNDVFGDAQRATQQLWSQ